MRTGWNTSGHVVEDMNAHMRLGVGPGHYFRALDAQDMAGIDVVLHQLLPGMTDMPHTAWVPGTDPEFFAYALARLGASHAHLQPRKKGRALCEIYGAFGWAEGLPMMKWMTDHMLVNGINRFVPHAFSPKYPDADCPPHFYAQGRHPQFPLFGRLMQYTQRMCHLLTGGEPMLSAAVLYNAEAEWCGGDKMLFQKVLKALTRRQLNADVVPADMLETAAVENGRLVINRHSVFDADRAVQRDPAAGAAGIPCGGGKSGLPGGVCGRAVPHDRGGERRPAL